MLERAKEYGGRLYKSTTKKVQARRNYFCRMGRKTQIIFFVVSQKVLLWFRVGHSLVQLHSYHLLFPFESNDKVNNPT